ncbi:hypothetical protein Pelo_13666 [Pelomyxa schiedti]|nr:hypothetical protein Pelo_13666 [Pelomyxa schiedti]
MGGGATGRGAAVSAPRGYGGSFILPNEVGQTPRPTSADADEDDDYGGEDAYPDDTDDDDQNDDCKAAGGFDGTRADVTQKTGCQIQQQQPQPGKVPSAAKSGSSKGAQDSDASLSTTSTPQAAAAESGLGDYGLELTNKITMATSAKGTFTFRKHIMGQNESPTPGVIMRTPVAAADSDQLRTIPARTTSSPTGGTETGVPQGPIYSTDSKTTVAAQSGPVYGLPSAQTTTPYTTVHHCYSERQAQPGRSSLGDQSGQWVKRKLKQQLEPLFVEDEHNPTGIPPCTSFQLKPPYQSGYRLQKVTEPTATSFPCIPLTDGFLSISQIEPSSEEMTPPIRLAHIAVSDRSYKVLLYLWEPSRKQYWTPNVVYEIPRFIRQSEQQQQMNNPATPDTINCSPVSQVDQRQQQSNSIPRDLHRWWYTFGSTNSVSWKSFAGEFFRSFQVDIRSLQDLVLGDSASTSLDISQWQKLYPYWFSYDELHLDEGSLEMWNTCNWFHGFRSREESERLVSQYNCKNALLVRCSDSVTPLYVVTIYRGNVRSIIHVRVGCQRVGETALWVEHLGMPQYEMNPPTSTPHLVRTAPTWYLLPTKQELFQFGGMNMALTRGSLGDLVTQVIAPVISGELIFIERTPSGPRYVNHNGLFL